MILCNATGGQVPYSHSVSLWCYGDGTGTDTVKIGQKSANSANSAKGKLWCTWCRWCTYSLYPHSRVCVVRKYLHHLHHCLLWKQSTLYGKVNEWRSGEGGVTFITSPARMCNIRIPRHLRHLRHPIPPRVFTNNHRNPERLRWES